ncbi:MAG: threonine ammonia-lyase [Synergistaceae bacterium]|nr:threonine ammonia-lyase [Synergistaceae bacterium]
MESSNFAVYYLVILYDRRKEKMLTLDKVYHAAYVLRACARKTDLIAAPLLSESHNLFLKTENLQVTGSFKLRGAYYKISQLSDEEKAKGIVACSAGNHAQGVALSATRHGIAATICMPDGAPVMKVESTRRLGANIELVKGAYDEAHDRAVQLVEETGATFIHPYDDDFVIAGQATIGLEILDQLEDVEAIIVPIGGGGLISGVAFAAKSLKPDIKIYGVQAAGAPSMYNSFKEHERKVLSSVSTFADGIAVKNPGENTFEIISKYVDDIVCVSEDEIAAAILALIEKQKLIAEGAGAVPVAAAMFNKLPIQNKKTVCVVSGGNIDVNILSRVITRGLMMTGRNVNLTIALVDKPGQLQQVSEIIASCGANVVSVYYDHGDPNMAINSCFLKLSLETLNSEQSDTIRRELAKAGFNVVK